MKDVTVPGTGFTFQAVLAVIREAAGFQQDRAVGELVLLKDDAAQLVLRLPGHEAWSGSESQDRLASLIESASEYIVRESQPFVLASYLCQMKRTSECEGALHRVLGSNSRDEVVAGYNLYGALLFELHQPAEAIKKFEHATEFDPKSAYAWNNWADLLRELGRNAEAADIEARRDKHTKS
ncbi:MAG: tetratricopeptide repeat protein [Candidatus Binatia bacterium]